MTYTGNAQENTGVFENCATTEMKSIKPALNNAYVCAYSLDYMSLSKVFKIGHHILCV